MPAKAGIFLCLLDGQKNVLAPSRHGRSLITRIAGFVFIPVKQRILAGRAFLAAANRRGHAGLLLLLRIATRIIETRLRATRRRRLLAIPGLAGALFRGGCLVNGFHDAVVMLGMLQIVFSQHAVAGRHGVLRQRQVLFMHLKGVAAYAGIRAVGIENLVAQRSRRTRLAVLLAHAAMPAATMTAAAMATTVSATMTVITTAAAA
jgi:hypothetical protein